MEHGVRRRYTTHFAMADNSSGPHRIRIIPVQDSALCDDTNHHLPPHDYLLAVIVPLATWLPVSLASLWRIPSPAHLQPVLAGVHRARRR